MRIILLSLLILPIVGLSQSNKFPDSGNVGIGTLSPTQKLHVYNGPSGGLGHYFAELIIEDDDHGMITILTPNINSGYYGFSDQDDDFVGGMQYNHSKDEMLFRVNNRSVGDMMINSVGNVGIGTGSPEYKLHVTNGIKIKKTTIGATLGSGENGWLRDDWLTGNYGPPKWDQSIQKWVRPGGSYNDIGGIVWQDEGTYFVRGARGENLEYSNTEFLNTSFLFADIFTGNVGLGTNTPGSWKLAVNGNIRAKEIKVETQGWSDFVFEKDYTLPTLEEVEKHIKEEGHLQDIPSAEEVKMDGFFLGEMDAKLLQKIEELMLYTIKQQKEIEALKAEITKLKSKR
ncbi:DUF4200 domain-containing protein [Galbibacter sp. BG1]|uniref:DUF4200 domain-containing protein n=1 Tax=Galbibacter sp. BG1 TaxID=1170699 RepID=UPI0015BCA721|nr:DUF4200 domain-containing protein [Galbibacter sp. BG1]QLE02016.1 DUF4200 domain-containing protein [Galbibacter sp. BG1]